MTAESLAPYTTLRVGGPARTFIEARTTEELIGAVARCDAAGEPVLLLGGGSNVVIPDAGFDGTVIRIATHGIEPGPLGGDHVFVTLAAGERWDRFAAIAAADGWSGTETLSGIPGSAGATPIQNVGAYGNEVSEVIVSVRAFDRTAREIVEFTAAECGFSYRSSVFKRTPGRWVILSVTLGLAVRKESVPIRYADLADRLGIAAGDTALPIQVRRCVLEVRRSKGMVLDIDDHDTWSVGSFFTNPIVPDDLAAALPESAPRWPAGDGLVKLSAGWLIDYAGFTKGFPGSGAPARLSTKHTLALTNRGTATAADIRALAAQIQAGVETATGVHLTPEANIL